LFDGQVLRHAAAATHHTEADKRGAEQDQGGWFGHGGGDLTAASRVIMSPATGIPELTTP
jgi:hypothetical protein